VSDISDDELMLMYCEGDADAFDVLFDRHRAPVYNFARVMLNGAEGAEDVLQETFISVARASKTYQARGRFRAWMMRIARNFCLNRIEAVRARRRLMARSSLDVVEPPHEPDTSERLVRSEEVKLLRHLVSELPERQREAIVLHTFEGMSYREMAEVLDVPVNTLKTLVHRARATLAGKFERMTGGQHDGV